MRKTKLVVGIVVAFLFLSCTMAFALESSIQPTGLLRFNKAKAFDGYTLVGTGNKAFLLDMEGKLVHKWDLKLNVGLYAVLLPNGNLLAGGSMRDKAPVNFGGSSGMITEYDWNGNVVWEWQEMTDTYVQHHCFQRMPNGNTLVLGWEYKSYEECIAKGRDPNTLSQDGYNNHGKVIKGLWPDYVREISPDKKVVWEWHVWDHLGKGEKEFDINFVLPKAARYMAGPDWTHFNTVDYIPETDQIILNSRNFGEFYLVNHKTGEMEYRWGNPSAYGKGKGPSFLNDGDQQLFGPHHASKVDNGNILSFDNGWHRPEGERSRVLEMDPKTGKIAWQWYSKMAHSFNTRYQGAVQKLPNGNYLITSSNSGHLLEVTGDKKAEIVWEWFNPYFFPGKFKCFATDDDLIADPMEQVMGNTIHRAYRYGKDYPGLKGKDLSKKENLVPGGCQEVWKTFAKEQAKADAPKDAPKPTTKSAAPKAPKDKGPVQKTTK
jgi:hypothetical protein